MKMYFQMSRFSHRSPSHLNSKLHGQIADPVLQFLEYFSDTGEKIISWVIRVRRIKLNSNENGASRIIFYFQGVRSVLKIDTEARILITEMSEIISNLHDRHRCDISVLEEKFQDLSTKFDEVEKI